MLSDKMINICNRFGFKLADRNADDGWVWSGEDLALWYQYTDDDIADEISPKHVMFDHDVLHELCHYLVAAPEQRDLPEFGLYWGVIYSTALGPKDGTYRLTDGTLNISEAFRKSDMAVVDAAEGNRQEMVVHILCCLIGEREGLSPIMSGWGKGRRLGRTIEPIN